MIAGIMASMGRYARLSLMMPQAMSLGTSRKVRAAKTVPTAVRKTRDSTRDLLAAPHSFCAARREMMMDMAAGIPAAEIPTARL